MTSQLRFGIGQDTLEMHKVLEVALPLSVLICRRKSIGFAPLQVIQTILMASFRHKSIKLLPACVSSVDLIASNRKASCLYDAKAVKTLYVLCGLLW
ncbi:hypothetical protein Dimus_028848 [Dionaea muscipula]